jgi:tetratricopeptide (TPR) repeat protein
MRRPSQPGQPGTPISGAAPASTDRAGELLGWGDACLEEGDVEAAAREYARALDRLKAAGGPALLAAYLRLGKANRVLGRVSACVHCYKKALEIDPQDETALRELIELHAAWGEWEQVASLRARLLDGEDPLAAVTQPDDLPTHDMAALRNAVVAARTNADRARAWLDLGHAAWFETQDRDEAVRAFQAAFIHDRSLHEAVEMLALALVTMRDVIRLESLCAALADATDAHSTAARETLRGALHQLAEGVRRGQS